MATLNAKVSGVREKRVSWADDVEGRRPARGSDGLRQHPGRGSCPPSLFALVATCRLVSVTLDVPPNDVTDDVVRLTETDASEAAWIVSAGASRRSPTRSAFRPVGGRAAAAVDVLKSSDNVDDDRGGLVVVVSSVRQDLLSPGSQQPLLTGDILLEVETIFGATFCYIHAAQWSLQ